MTSGQAITNPEVNIDIQKTFSRLKGILITLFKDKKTMTPRDDDTDTQLFGQDQIIIISTTNR